jgi:hypothetical protein
LSPGEFQYRSKTSTVHLCLQALFLLSILNVECRIRFPPSFHLTSLSQAPSKRVRQRHKRVRL